jgi:hypothetical protein
MQVRPDRVEAGLEKMAAEIAVLSGRVARLAARVAALEKALPDRLEASGTVLAPPASVSPGDVEAIAGRDPAAVPPRAGPGGSEAVDFVSLLTPAGRTCLVFGGAYFLRALTETGRLPLKAGVALGFVYALTWLVAADRAALRRPVSGTFHGLAAVLIALPIVWETSMRFGRLPPGWSAAAGALVLAGAFAVARRRRLQTLAGAACLGTTGLALALAVASGTLVPYAVLLVAASVAAWWLADACGWAWLKWPPALAAAIAVAGLGLRARLAPPADPATTALAVSLSLVLLTLVMVGRRVGHGRAVRPFEAVQTLGAIVAGLGAAFAVTANLAPEATVALEGMTLVLGIAAYGAALALVRSRPEEGLNFHYCVSLGLLLVVVATASLLSGAPRDIAFTVLALAAAWLGARAVHPVFAAHSAAFAVAAAVSSGLVACSARVWLTTPHAWPAFPLTGAVVLVAALPGGLIPRRAPSRALEVAASMSRLVLAGVLVATIGSLVVLVVGPLVAGTPPDPGRLASLKTIVLAAAAVALALVARLPFGGELGWLAYPALIAGGVKFVAEDFRVSTASMLFVALAVYGTALILTSRIRLGKRPPSRQERDGSP